MLGIYNDGPYLQTKMISLDGARSDSNSVFSQLHHYLTHIVSRHGTGFDLFLHIDSCTDRNKKNIFLRYCILRLIHRHHETGTLKHMTVFLTKFGPDREFGSICTRMNAEHVLSLSGFKSKDRGWCYCKFARVYIWAHGTCSWLQFCYNNSISNTSLVIFCSNKRSRQ